jgi:hypothetical protein
MFKPIKIITGTFFIALLLLSSAQKAQASEGNVEIKSTVGTDLRCFASSVFIKTRNYKILVSCRNVVYPPNDDLLVYVLWASPVDEGKPIRLGSLQFGKVEFNASKAFTELFITSERTDRPRSPSENVIARGIVESVEFLETGESGVTQLPTEPAETFGEILEQPTPALTATPTPEEGSLFSRIRRGGIILAVGVFVVLVVLAILTRSRR